jgi:asparagine synthase (glutamine-hydrolysing)
VSALKQPALATRPSARRLGEVLANAELDFVQRYRNKQCVGAPDVKASLYAAGFRESVAGVSDTQLLTEIAAAASSKDFIDRLTLLDFEFYLPNDMLTKVDRTSMASSLEVRVPFLDEEIIELAARIPSGLKLHGMTTKYLLRKLSAKVMPPSIWRRRKRGFSVPLHEWFRGDLAGTARELLLDQRTLARGYFDRKGVESLLADHENHLADHGDLIFALISFETWSRVMLDGDGA